MGTAAPWPDFEYYAALLRVTGVHPSQIRYMRDWFRKRLGLPPGEALKTLDRKLLAEFYESHPKELFFGSFPVLYRIMRTEGKLPQEAVELLKLLQLIRDELRENIEDGSEFDVDLHRSFLFLESFVRKPLTLKRYVQMESKDVEILPNGHVRIRISWKRKGKGVRKSSILLPSMGSFYRYHTEVLLPSLHPSDPNPPLWTKKKVPSASLASIVPLVFLQKGEGYWDIDSLKYALAEIALMAFGTRGVREVGGSRRALEKVAQKELEMVFFPSYWSYLFEG